MNGIHDMGGMQDMGPIQYEKNEPVFHAPWEGRALAMIRAMALWGKWRTLRVEMESLAPAEYLRMSYYERWFTAFVQLLVKNGLVTAAEIERGRPAPGSYKAKPALTAEQAPLRPFKNPMETYATSSPPRFVVGQQVRARDMNPTGHTRLPRYVRGRIGAVERDHGVSAFPDTNVYFRGENPQHVYSVRFTARELWGEQASPRDSVHLDLWDDYLEPA